MTTFFAQEKGNRLMVNRVSALLNRPPQDGATHAERLAKRVSDVVSEGLRRIERQIGANPILALSVALGIGLVSGWIIKRRK